MRTMIPPSGAAETMTPESRPCSSCASVVECSRAASVPFMDADGGGGGLEVVACAWACDAQVRTAPAMRARDGRTRVGYPFMGPPLLLSICQRGTAFATVASWTLCDLVDVGGARLERRKRRARSAWREQAAV